MNGETKPRGSNTELTVDRIPLRDRVLSCIMILKWSVSGSIHDSIMNTQSTFNCGIVTDEEVVLCVYCSIFFWDRAYNFSAVRGKLVQPKATFLT